MFLLTSVAIPLGVPLASIKFRTALLVKKVYICVCVCVCACVCVCMYMFIEPLAE